MDGISPREGRCYTRARRFPWVIGQIQGWTIPFGPYTATQLGVLVVGFWLVVQTYGVWRHLGPFGLLVVAMPPAVCWTARHAKVEGRTPLRAAAGLITLLAEPRYGRIHGRVARQPRPARVCGAIRLAVPAAAPAAAAHEAPSPVPRSDGGGVGTVRQVPVTAVQALLAECAARRR